MTYSIKFPHTPWPAVRRTRRWRSRRRAEEYVETAYAPGRTQEPCVYLVEIGRDGMRIIANWVVARREWVRRYTIRLPRTGWADCRWRTLARAQEYVERVYTPTSTQEPCVEIVDDTQRVIATWIVRDREWVR